MSALLRKFSRFFLSPVEITGKPNHIADFVSESATRTRSVFYIAIPLWILMMWAHQELLIGTYAEVAEHYSKNPVIASQVMATIPISVMIAAATLGIISLHRRLSIKAAHNNITMLVILAIIAGESSQLFLSNGNPNHIPSFAVAALVAFSIAPLTVFQQFFAITLLFILPVVILLLNQL